MDSMNAVTEVSYALDTFYFLLSGVLVMWMAVGFTMLEAGMVRTKNTVEILAKNVGLFAIASVMYLIVGYNIMYDGSASSIIPGLSFLVGGDNSVEAAVAGDAYYSDMSDFFFQLVFAGAAMSIVSGAVAERMKLFAFLAFAVVMTAVIYPVQGYWSWGGGFLDELGYIDYAGSGIVHFTGAVAALAGVLLLGARKGKYGPNGEVRAIPGANLPLATLGTFILWMGWFGFNGGSVLATAGVDSANEVAIVFLNTNTAAAGGAIAAMIVSKLMFGKADLTMLLNGALAGLVTITAEPSTPTPLLATIFGMIGGILVVFSIVTLDKLRIDDPVGAISVHGVVGLLGLLLVPLTNDGASFGGQIAGALTIFIWVFVTSLIVWSILKATIGIRVSEEDEYEGLDVAECGMEAYPEFHGSGN